MAVYDNIPGLEVEVCVDGQPLREYEYDEEDGQQQRPNTVCKYVESVSDKEYAIHLRLDKHHVMDCPNYIVHIYIDGKFMHAPVLTKTNFATSFFRNSVTKPFMVRSVGRPSDVPGNPALQRIQKYKFSRIETSEMFSDHNEHMFLIDYSSN